MAKGVNLEILESRDNRLVERRELTVRIVHWPEGTPPRQLIREHIAKILGVNPDTVYVRKITTEYGSCESLARVHVYDTVERALKFEPEHVVKKNRGESKGGEKGG